MNKIGLFGGTFNPIHLGHVNSMLTVADTLGLTTVKVIPSCITPLRDLTEEGAKAKDRSEMVRLAIREYPEVLEIDEQEVAREGLSYSIETINEYLKTFNGNQIYLIIGADQFEQFDKWKSHQEILEKVNVVVTTRPGAYLPYELSDFPEGVRDMVEDFDHSIAVLKNGRAIHFMQLEDKEMASSVIRKCLRSKRIVSEYLDAGVEQYIKDKKLYNTVGDKISDYKPFTLFCGKTLDDRKAINTQGFDLSGLEMPSEYTLVTSGTSTRHTQALSEILVRSVKDEFGVFPYSIEGRKEGRWVVLDYGALIVHIFYDYVRSEYCLEDLWAEGKSLKLESS